MSGRLAPLAQLPRPSPRVVLVAIAVVLLVAAWFGGPSLLRRLAFFRVRQIELVGVRNLSPDAVIAALRLPPSASVWDDRRVIDRRERGLAGVADARVVRRLPGALKVLVREVTPVAFVAGQRGLAVVDAAARVLPFDPARSALDLPIAASADTTVIAVLARVQETDPALFREVTAARRARGAVLLELGARRVLLRSDAGPEVIRGVVLVQQDLEARGRPYEELDARYAGQVVVRRRAA